ncbi:MAG: ArsA family ATPase [Deltaproteobacteria bacterium]|nr:ArsA family ATPase [Deltaproteobacteria bacterium]MBW2042963.1 ArsA family ATPase [Deltaproteobacteria bacterium]
MKEAINIFYMGKGGVGKSTTAALNSLFLAREGFKVLLVSLDPAHNQSDIFKSRFSDKPKQIIPGLKALEIDQEYWIRKYLKDVHEQINRTYSYLTSFNLEKYFKVIRYSPGLEEYALLLAFKEVRRKYSRSDFLVFDMAPTALSLKFFNLPSLSLVWINHLLALRKEIIKKRELITKVRLLKKEIETDKVLSRVERSLEDYTALKELFEDSGKTQINLVLNPDQLSLAESLRIVNELKGIDISLRRIIINKMRQDSPLEDIYKAFKGIPALCLPFSETPLIGLDTLTRFLKNNHDKMVQQP